MKLITISGLDGSGKTTQLDLIEKELKKKSKVARFHMIDFSIANKILGKRSKRKKSAGDHKTQASKFAIFLRKVAIIIDVFRFRFYFLMKSRENKLDYLLVDRYFFDQIVNIKYLDEKIKLRKKSFWQRVVENQLVEPYLKIYLETKPQKIMKRDRPAEQGEKYLETKNKIFDIISKRWKLIKINGNQDIETIHKKINQLI